MARFGTIDLLQPEIRIVPNLATPRTGSDVLWSVLLHAKHAEEHNE